jgi:hypothetical protein
VAQVGDRVEVKTKGGTRVGVVMNVSGSLLRLRWDTGEETTLVPAAGSLSVVAASQANPRNPRRRAGTAAKRSKATGPKRTPAASKANATKKAAPQ